MRSATVVLLTILVTAATVALAGPAAASSTHTCTAPKTFPEAGGKFLTLAASKPVSCTKASAVATAFAKCESKNGKGGRCVKKVLGYACRQTATTVGTTRSESNTCANGSKKVIFRIERQV